MTRHDVDSPDPLCWGDDPCVCEQLIEARQQTIRNCIAALQNLHDYEADRAAAALRALLEKP